MDYILNIETATKNCSVALAKEGKTIGCKEMAEEGYSHAERLHVFIEEIIKEAGIALKDLSAIAVSQGPGSYTGLRIGVSAAKGLCYALDIPLIAVDTLQALASQVTVSPSSIRPDVRPATALSLDPSVLAMCASMLRARSKTRSMGAAI